MTILYKVASADDILNVSRLRMEYLEEAYNGLNPNDSIIILKNNILYLNSNLNKNCFIAIAEADNKVVSCAYLNVMQKAANLRFMNGYYGEIYGVFTQKKYRNHGFATHLIQLLIEESRKLELPFIQLEASSDGYNIYKRIGFIESNSNYKEMKYIL